MLSVLADQKAAGCEGSKLSPVRESNQDLPKTPILLHKIADHMKNVKIPCCHFSTTNFDSPQLRNTLTTSLESSGLALIKRFDSQVLLITDIPSESELFHLIK